MPVFNISQLCVDLWKLSSCYKEFPLFANFQWKVEAVFWVLKINIAYLNSIVNTVLSQKTALVSIQYFLSYSRIYIYIDFTLLLRCIVKGLSLKKIMYMRTGINAMINAIVFWMIEKQLLKLLRDNLNIWTRIAWDNGFKDYFS